MLEQRGTDAIFSGFACFSVLCNLSQLSRFLLFGVYHKAGTVRIAFYLEGLYDTEAKLYVAAVRRYPFQAYYRRERKAFEVAESSPEGEPVSTGLVDARGLG